MTATTLYCKIYILCLICSNNMKSLGLIRLKLGRSHYVPLEENDPHIFFKKVLTNFFPCRVKFSACRKLLFSLNGGALKLQSLIWSLVWYNPFLPLHTVACVDLVSEPINIQSAQNETVEDKATLQSAGGGGSHAFKSVSWKTRPA